MTDDEDDFVQQTLRADIEKECRVLGETPKPQNVLRALHLCFKHDLEVPAWVKQGFQHAYRRGVYEKDLKSWDEVFGGPPKDARRRWRYLPKQFRVLKEVGRVKAAGISLNEEEFGAIGSRLGVGGSSTVKQLYADAKREFWWLKYLKR